MRVITDEAIVSMAPDSSSLSSARSISRSGDFVKLYKSADDSLYMGHCKGSGKNPYITSADFSTGDVPVFRCNCPSRKFPCKHSLGLLFEIAAGKTFETTDVPEDIISKRKKIETKEEKKSKPADEGAEKAAPKVNKAARAKKLQKQLEGLDIVSKLLGDILLKGFGAADNATVKMLRDMAKQLGNFYIPGPQAYIRWLADTIDAIKKGDAASVDYGVALAVKLHSLVKKSREYITSKLETDDVGDDDNTLYEALGGIWQLDRLKALGLTREDATLVQLAYVTMKDEYTDTTVSVGYWCDTATGEIVRTHDYEEFKSAGQFKTPGGGRYVVKSPLLTIYPAVWHRRVRWEECTVNHYTRPDMAAVMEKGQPVATVVKLAKDYLKNPLSADYYLTLVSFAKIGRTENGFTLEDKSGARLNIKPRDEHRNSAKLLPMVPMPDMLENKVLFGALFYDRATESIAIDPVSIVTPDDVIFLTI